MPRASTRSNRNLKLKTFGQRPIPQLYVLNFNL